MPAPASAWYVPLAAPEQRHGDDDDDDEECYYTERARYVPLVAPAAPPDKRHGEDEEECCFAARARYVPLRRRENEEYAARRALFLQSYRFTTAVSARERDDGGSLRGRVARRVREARAAGREAVARAVSRARGAARWWIGVGVARAWRLGWWRPPRASVGCFGGHGRNKLHYLHHFA